MDYSKFYHDWLQLDLAPEEVPNFYQILGIRNMEPDVQKIEAAFQNTLDRLQSVNGMTNPEAYTAITSRVLEAHKVFIDPNQKHAYDLQLSENTGERVWKGYERPSFLTRLRQMCLIAFSFILGLGVMFVMAFTVERNPDGSIIFREEAQARKVPPFASQLEYVVFRPSIAQDYQKDGYAVALNKAAQKVDSTLAAAVSETVSEPNTEAQDTELPVPNEIAENQSGESELEEFSQILSEKIAAPNSQKVAKVNRRSPLYNKTVALNDEPSDVATDLNSGKNELESELLGNTGLNDLSIEVVEEDSPKAETKIMTDFPPEEPATELPTVASAEQKPAFSLTSVIGLLEKVRSNLDFSKPNADEAYVLLQYQTIHEILQKLGDSDGTLDLKEVKAFTDYTLNVTSKLSRKKHIDKAYQLCDMILDFGTKRNLPNVDEAVAFRRNEIVHYEEVYQEAQDVLKKLETNQDDPDLNMLYATWLWQDTGNVEDSFPYLIKTNNDLLRKLASYEMKLAQNKDLAKPETTLQIADTWWYIAEYLPDKYAVVVREHARKLYSEVDENRLNDAQKERLASL